MRRTRLGNNDLFARSAFHNSLPRLRFLEVSHASAGFRRGGFEIHRKLTRREIFLNEMDLIVPWATLIKAVESFYPKPTGAYRPPIGLDRMLRIHLLQRWFNLSDPGVEEALRDSRALRLFANIDFGREPVSDETTICKFRHLLEEHELGYLQLRRRILLL